MLATEEDVTVATAPLRDVARVTKIRTVQLFLTVNLVVKLVFLTLVTATRLGMVARGGLHITVNSGLEIGDVVSVPEQAKATNGRARQSLDRVRMIPLEYNR